ncbi:LIC_20245 family lipoprotein [Leptospira kmetyi]|uniref:LIC_20245 family lipoprotein n=1 Tax=Leptospira kmetyi TaxID=408139 RepID=UPI003EC127EA
MKKKIVYSSIIIILIVLSYFAFSETGNGFFGNDGDKNDKLQSGLSRNTVNREEDSIFESGNFLDFSKSGEPENVSDSETDSVADNASAANGGYSSLSPEEKERIRKEVIQKVKPLADRFPNNSLIPRELTKEQEEKRKKDEEKMDEIRGALLEGREVAKPDMEFYLDSKIKKSNDMTEILEYSVKFFKEAGRNYPDSSLKIIEDRLHSLRESKDELLNARKNLDMPIQ